MSSNLYVIDTTAESLVLLPPASTVYPNLLTYSFYNLSSGVGASFQNFYGEEVAVLRMSAHFHNETGGATGFWSFDAKIDGTSFLSQGSPSPLTIPVPFFNGFSYSDVWEASDMANPPRLGVGSTFQLISTIPSNAGSGNAVFDVCMVPSSQLALLGVD